jgi:hypothetical protein
MSRDERRRRDVSRSPSPTRRSSRSRRDTYYGEAFNDYGERGAGPSRSNAWDPPSPASREGYYEPQASRKEDHGPSLEQVDTLALYVQVLPQGLS